MTVVVDWSSGKKVIREGTVDDFPADHPFAIAARRKTMTVSPFQAKTALEGLGLLATAEAIVTAQGGIALRAWNEAIEWRRTSPTMLALAPALGLNDEQLDDLFTTAAEIEA